MFALSPRKTVRLFVLSAFVFLSLLVSAEKANAVSITATEIIRDSLPLDALNKNLERIRSNSEGLFLVEDSDAVIEAENLVNSNFGILNLGDVSYRHDLTWLDPAATSFTSASLSITAFGALGNDDLIYVDNILIGSLDTGLFSTTIFSSDNPVSLAFLFADGFLNVFVDKNATNCFLNPACLNSLSVFSSELTVTYEAIPEPGTMLLLGSGLAAIGLRRRKKLVA